MNNVSFYNIQQQKQIRVNSVWKFGISEGTVYRTIEDDELIPVQIVLTAQPHKESHIFP